MGYNSFASVDYFIEVVIYFFSVFVNIYTEYPLLFFITIGSFIALLIANRT